MGRPKIHCLVIEASPDEAVMVFTADGSPLAANRAAERVLASCLHPGEGTTPLHQLLARCGSELLTAAHVDTLPPFTTLESTAVSQEPASVCLSHVANALTALDHAALEWTQRSEHSLTADFVASAEGELRKCNSEFARVFGFAERADVVGVKLVDLVADPIQREALQDTLTARTTERRRALTLRSRSGARVHGVLNLRAVAATDGAIQFEGAIYDRTEEQRLEEQMLQSQRIEAVGRLAGGIAHDFNNLLTVILAGAQLLERSLPPGSAELGRASQIRVTAERAGELTRRLLAVGRRQLMRPREIDLNELLLSLKKFLRSVLPNNVELDIVCGTCLPAVHADPGMLEQVVLNLAVNARDAMADGGRLTIETECVQITEADADPHADATPGRYVLMSVCDTGCGMSPEVLDHAFEAFFTTKPPGQGSGLGLASTYGIVKQHDGFVHACSEPAIGTTIKIHLPVAVRAIDEVRESAQEPGRDGCASIVLAEDEPAVRSVFIELLQLGGYEVLAAADGEEAVRLVQKNVDRVQLVVLDVVMPGMGGVAAYEQIRMLAPDLPVLFTSGYTGDAVRGLLDSDALLDFVPKPSDPEVLLSKIRQALDRRLRATERREHLDLRRD